MTSSPDSLYDVADEGAYRLTVALELLEASQDRDPEYTEDSGGYDVAILRDVLRDVRDNLREAVKLATTAAGKEARQRLNGGKLAARSKP